MRRQDARRGTLPRWLAWAVALTCLSPSLCNLFGVDFGIEGVPLDLSEAVLLSPHELDDALSRSFAGIATHALLGWTAFYAALLTLVLALAHFSITKDIVPPVVGTALFFTGGINVLHTLAADRLIYAEVDVMSLVAFTWALCRMLGALVVIVGVGILLLIPGSGERTWWGKFALAVIVGLGLASCGAVYVSARATWSPRTVFPDSIVTRPYDLAPLLPVLCAAPLFFRLRRRRGEVFSDGLTLSLFPQVGAQVHMALGSTSLFDNHFNIAHFLQSAALLVPFGALCLEYIRTLRRERGHCIDTLQETLERLELAVRGSSDGLWDARLRPGEDTWSWASTDIYYSPRCKELLGYSDEELQETALSGCLLHPEDRERVSRAVHEHLAQQARYDAEFRLRTKSGEYRWFSARGEAVRDEAGKPVRMAGSLRDITDRKQVEQELKSARDAALQAAELKSQFAANMSHEIRTPLNGIFGMTDLLLETPLSEEQREYAETVRRCAGNLLRIVNEILDFSKIEASRLELQTIPFGLRGWLDEVLESLRPAAVRKGLGLAADVRPEVPDALTGDPDRLRQILASLVGNAIKFTERGEVVVRVTVESQTAAAAVLHFAVADTGIGISPEKQGLIFEAFAQADGSTTRPYEGIGLGLTIAARLVGMMHGRIWLESAEGAGSAFHFTAGFGVQTGAVCPAPASSPMIGRSPVCLRVLLAEHDPVDRVVVCRLLEKRGHTVVTVEDGRDAVALLSEEQFDVVLLDVQLPGTDGFDVVAAIRAGERPAGGHVPIVALTAHALAGDRQRCLDSGMDRYLAKPVQAVELFAVVEPLDSLSEWFFG